MNPTDVTEVTWGIYKPDSANMGIIKLDSFDPEEIGIKGLAVQKAVMIIRSLLANELKDTYSVMYELRGNSGGSLEFANSLVQLSKPDFQPFGDRYLMNKITQSIFFDGKDPNAYLRPMGVLNDARCYSACEVFSGAIQGHDAGTIFGEDEQTGGGGATVKELDPLSSMLPLHTSKIGVTQTVRTGRYKGQTIEDVGIETDIVVRPRWSDLQPDSTTNTQYDRIADSLARIGQRMVRLRPLVFTSSLCSRLMERLLPLTKEESCHHKTKFSIPVSTVGSALGNSHITIVGKTAGKQVLKTIRNVRIIPDDDKYMKISTTGFTFQASLIPLDSTNPQLPRLGMAGTT
ncbi:hypothetical protein BASA50_000577 [Batrachochytrium salamandrivorans]|uniref:Tail specific protease domain-containing protein n=1 Tax=Batrachochytrium salamandrivorans TaxID=1357716 RepID=A0ABQ8ETN8_9FUNG|nr:hypothetical protein BASA50_000577 [Batrachochytrium salamandrivorans]